jgi:hypothetical protein
MFNTSLRYNFNSNTLLTPNQQTPIREQGFGGHFKDTPPAYIEETKTDNKIERSKKPVKKENKQRKKKKVYKDI